MNRKDSRNSTSKSQQKYIKLNLKNILKGGADEEPSPYNEDTMVVDHPYKEEAYDIGSNNDGCNDDQTGGKLTIPYDPFSPHSPFQNPFNPLVQPVVRSGLPKIDKLYPINGPYGGVGLSTVSPTPYRLNQHSFPNNNIQNIKIPLIPSNYMLPGINSGYGLGLSSAGYGLGLSGARYGLGLPSIGLGANRFGSYQLKNYLNRVINKLQILFSRKRYASRFEKLHINEQINSLSEQIERVIKIYKPNKTNNVHKKLEDLLNKIKNLL